MLSEGEARFRGFSWLTSPVPPPPASSASSEVRGEDREGAEGGEDGGEKCQTRIAARIPALHMEAMVAVRRILSQSDERLVSGAGIAYHTIRVTVTNLTCHFIIFNKHLQIFMSFKLSSHTDPFNLALSLSS